MIWFKWRTSWAYGSGSWEYGNVEKSSLKKMDMDIREYIDEVYDPNSENGWSDKYRGFEYLEIDEWPIDFLEEKIDEYATRAARYIELHTQYQEILVERKKNAIQD